MKQLPLLGLACVFASVANGQTLITQTIPFSGWPSFTQPLVFNKYNGNVADILSIKIEYTFNIDGGQFLVDNDSNVAANDVIVNFGAAMNGSSSDVTLLNSSFNPVIGNISAVNTATFNLGPNVGDGTKDYDPSGPDGAVLVGKPVSTSGGDFIGSMFWGGFVGSGTYTINANSAQIGSLSYNSGVETASTPVFANGTVKVTYAVPEPTSFGLLGLSAAGLLLRRRR